MYPADGDSMYLKILLQREFPDMGCQHSKTIILLYILSVNQVVIISVTIHPLLV